MMRYELGLEKPDAQRAKKSALNIGIAYIVGGTIPLLGYVFADSPLHGLYYSAGITVVCLLIFGYFKSKLMGQNPFEGAWKTTLIGIVAAAAAFLIAKLVSH
jgi:VIT1/CCC1 family predicted Fe2+/Mn2+ transporter